MAGRPKFNAEETDLIVRHYLNGMSLRTLAKEMSSSVPTIRKYVATRVTIRPRGRPKQKRLMAFDPETLPITAHEKIVVDSAGVRHSIDNMPRTKKIADFPTTF